MWFNQPSDYPKVKENIKTFLNPTSGNPQANKKLHSLSIINNEIIDIITGHDEENFNSNTVKLYDASTSPIFLVVIVAIPNWVSASNVGMLTLKIFPGLLKKYISI